ncbi:hypothetical protein ACFQX7_13195 [Luedemannella flava]
MDDQTHPLDPVSPARPGLDRTRPDVEGTQPTSPARPETIYARAAVRVPAGGALRQATDEYPMVDDPRHDPRRAAANPQIPGFRQPRPCRPAALARLGLVLHRLPHRVHRLGCLGRLRERADGRAGH